MSGAERTSSLAAVLAVLLNVALLTWFLVRHPSLHAWLLLSGVILLCCLLAGSVLAFLESRR